LDRIYYPTSIYQATGTSWFAAYSTIRYDTNTIYLRGLEPRKLTTWPP